MLKKIAAILLSLFVVASNASANCTLGNAMTETMFKQCLKEAPNNNAEVQFFLGRFYFEGKHVKQDYAKGLEMYKKSALQGYQASLNTLGYNYLHGIGVDQNTTKSIYWYKKSAELGSSFAADNLIKIYKKVSIAKPVAREKKRLEHISLASKKTIEMRKQCKPKLEPIGFIKGKWNKSNVIDSLKSAKSISSYQNAIPYLLKGSDEYPKVSTESSKRLGNDINEWKKDEGRIWTKVVNLLNENCLYKQVDKIVLSVGLNRDKEVLHAIGKSKSDANLNNDVLTAIKQVPLDIVEKKYIILVEQKRQEAIAAEKERKRLAAEARRRVNLKNGVTYKYFSDGSCSSSSDEYCMNFEQYKNLCGQAAGVTGRGKEGPFMHSSIGRYVAQHGSFKSAEIEWKPHRNKCTVMVTVTGMYYGSSKRVTGLGEVSSFIYKGGEVLVYKSYPILVMGDH